MFLCVVNCDLLPLCFVALFHRFDRLWPRANPFAVWKWIELRGAAFGTEVPSLVLCFVKEYPPCTNMAPETMASQKESFIFQPSIFRGELLVSGRGGDVMEDFIKWMIFLGCCAEFSFQILHLHKFVLKRLWMSKEAVSFACHFRRVSKKGTKNLLKWHTCIQLGFT